MTRTQFFVPSASSFIESFRQWLVPLSLGDGVVHESVYFDDDLLTLNPEQRACIRRRIVPGDVTTLRDAYYTIDLPQRLRDHTPGYGEIVDLKTATDVFRRTFNRDHIKPYCAVRFRRRRFGIPDHGYITLDTDVEYFSMLGDDVVSLGTESYPRVTLRLHKRPEGKLGELIRNLPHLPHMSKRWMAYYHMERRFKRELKRVNELPGYEYEIKLRANHLDIDVALLPFPIHRVYQSQCVRRYYDGYRVSFRLARATMATKGEVELIDGVPRRKEQKQKELSAWSLPDTHLEMRRIKKTYLLMNPESQRTYNLCLDLCLGRRAQTRMHQIEIEYVGTLNSSPGSAGRTVEKAVIADMTRIRDVLMQRYGFAISTKTKRDFARTQDEHKA